MSQPTRYHQGAYALAGYRPAPSAANEASVLAFENRTGVAIPAALRELMLADGWPRFLHEAGNLDAPADLDRLDESRWTSHEPLAAGYLPFMDENQGVCSWAVRLDAGNDPAVVVDIDHPDEPAWEPSAPSLSQWVRCYVWDGIVSLRDTLWSAQAPVLEASTLAHLQAHWDDVGVTFGWPGHTMLRFENDIARVLIRCCHDCTDWHVAPRGEGPSVPAAPAGALSGLEVDDATRKSFYVWHTGQGEQELRAWRGTPV